MAATAETAAAPPTTPPLRTSHTPRGSSGTPPRPPGSSSLSPPLPGTGGRPRSKPKGGGGGGGGGESKGLRVWAKRAARSPRGRGVALAAVLVVATAVPLFVVWHINTSRAVDTMVSRTIAEAGSLVSYEILNRLGVLDGQIESIFDELRLNPDLLKPGHASALWTRQTSASLRDSTQLSIILIPTDPLNFDPMMESSHISLVNVTLSLVAPLSNSTLAVAQKEVGVENGFLCMNTVSLEQPGLSRVLCQDNVIRWSSILRRSYLDGAAFSDPILVDVLGTSRLLINLAKVLVSNNTPIAWSTSGIEVALITGLLSDIELQGLGFGYLLDYSGLVMATLGSVSINASELGTAFPNNCSNSRISGSYDVITQKTNLSNFIADFQLGYRDEFGIYKLKVSHIAPYPTVNWTLVLAIDTQTYTSSVDDSIKLTVIITIAIVVVVFLIGIFSSISLSHKTPSVSPETKIDLDAGITKIIEKLRFLRKKADKKSSAVIDDIIEHLTHTGDLFMPDLKKQTDFLDSDIQKWLNDEITPMSLLQDSSHTNIPPLTSRLQSVIVSSPRDLDLESFAFDVFELPTEGILERVTIHALLSLGVLQQLKIPLDYVRSFIAELETHYRNNAYHNSIHAADVVQCLYYLAIKGLRGLLGPENALDIFALILAGAAHDVGHPGVNNAFLIATGDELALHYNDRSVLENFHASFSMKIFLTKYASSWGLSTKDLKYLRGLFINLVLSTDVSLHFEIISKFKTLLEDPNCNLKENKDHRSQLLCMAIKTADISNVMRPHKQMLKWVWQLTQEFFNQGDQEKQRGLPLSPFTDREAGVSKLPKLQTNFISLIAEPLVETLDRVIPLPDLIENLHQNSDYWSTNTLPENFDVHVQ
ncbi:3'5'-cyclic nucleotide phosphodiesterase [Pelomyxa schiedti]|nr:3'5'-cyclic nucleotide phosphodiesterase [Pelomyxa schiedti]